MSTLRIIETMIWCIFNASEHIIYLPIDIFHSFGPYRFKHTEILHTGHVIIHLFLRIVLEIIQTKTTSKIVQIIKIMKNELPWFWKYQAHERNQLFLLAAHKLEPHLTHSYPPDHPWRIPLPNSQSPFSCLDYLLGTDEKAVGFLNWAKSSDCFYRYGWFGCFLVLPPSGQHRLPIPPWWWAPYPCRCLELWWGQI